MKQLIIILHLVSGSTLLVNDPGEASWLLRSVNNFNQFFIGHQLLNIDGNKVHVNMTNIEYIEEKYIDVPDLVVEKPDEK
jgi:hypothetical protein